MCLDNESLPKKKQRPSGRQPDGQQLQRRTTDIYHDSAGFFHRNPRPSRGGEKELDNQKTR